MGGGEIVYPSIAVHAKAASPKKCITMAMVRQTKLSASTPRTAGSIPRMNRRYRKNREMARCIWINVLGLEGNLEKVA